MENWTIIFYLIRMHNKLTTRGQLRKQSTGAACDKFNAQSLIICIYSIIEYNQMDETQFLKKVESG